MNNSFSLIELLDQELESFQISPLSATKFMPVNTLVNLELEF